MHRRVARLRHMEPDASETQLSSDVRNPPTTARPALAAVTIPARQSLILFTPDVVASVVMVAITTGAG